MAFKTHINDATGNQPGQITGQLTDFGLEGVFDLARLDFKVSGTAGLAVNVAKGEAFVENDSWVYGSQDQRFWHVASSATVSAVIPANSSGNPRIDIACIKVDTAVSPGAQGVNASSIAIVTGTAAASPTAPATPSNYLKLAEIAVANGASSISDGNITDYRVQAFMKNQSIEEPTLNNNKHFYAKDSGGTVTNVAAINSANYLDIGAVNIPATLLSPVRLSDCVIEGGGFTATVASNNLTVALKTTDGSAPTTTKPVHMYINGTKYTITTSKALVLNAGSNYGNQGAADHATFERDWHIYAYVHSGLAEFGISHKLGGRTYADFSPTTTDATYFTGTATPSSTDQIFLAGTFNAILSASASFNWSLPTAAYCITSPIYTPRFVTYSPALTNITLSNGTLAASFMKSFGIIYYTFKFTMGGSSSVSGRMTFNKPFPASSIYTDRFFEGEGILGDTGVETYGGKCQGGIGAATTKTELVGLLASGTYITEAATSSTVPFTWGTGDFAFFTGWYVAA